MAHAICGGQGLWKRTDQPGLAAVGWAKRGSLSIAADGTDGCRLPNGTPSSHGKGVTSTQKKVTHLSQPKVVVIFEKGATQSATSPAGADESLEGRTRF